MTKETSSSPLALTKANDIFLTMVQRQMENHQINMDEYTRLCVLNAVSAIHTVIEAQGISWGDPNLDNGNIAQILLIISSLKLNAAATPREVYFQLRNVKTKTDGADRWKKQIEMGIEGDGNDALLSRYGRNVEEVCQYWAVREGDVFEYPAYDGINVTPPKWQPKGTGKFVRVVYPIKKKDGTVEYHVGERADVIKNLIAHVNQNLMRETFGIASDYFKATSEQKAQISTKKEELLRQIQSLGLDAALDDASLQKYISPAWTEPHSRETMILRKMRNNIVKKIPKDFANGFLAAQYELANDDRILRAEAEAQMNANTIPTDIVAEYTIVDDPGSSPPSAASSIEMPEAESSKEPAKETAPASQANGQTMMKPGF